MFTTYTDGHLLDHLLGPGSFAKPTVVYLAAFLGDPAGGGPEVTGGGYVRKLAAFSLAANVANNSSNIQFPVATTDWGIVSWVACYDDVSAGNQLLTAPLTTPITIITGDVLLFPASTLTITLS